MNIGLNLLRIVLTLGVVLDHFWWSAHPENYTGVYALLWNLRTLAVPAFMTMTFFFTSKRFITGDVAWIKKRFVRLYEPFVFWAVAYYLIKLGLSCVSSRYSVSMTDLLWQLLLGSSQTLCMQFWFHADLIILTILFFTAFRLVRTPRANLYFGLGAMVIGFTLQYTSWNDALFGWMPFEAKYPLGRVASMLPYGGAGFLLAAAKESLDQMSAGMRVALALFGGWLAYMMMFYNVCPQPHSEVGYVGARLNGIAWGVMFLFYYIPFDKMPAIFGQVVLFLSRYCMGVYCIHLLLGQVMFDFLFGGTPIEADGCSGVRVMTLTQNLIVWATSYVLCWLISLVPAKFCQRIVQ